MQLPARDGPPTPPREYGQNDQSDSLLAPRGRGGGHPPIFWPPPLEWKPPPPSSLPTFHPSPQVVECHGALRDASEVLYGDALPARFFACLDQDFPVHPGPSALPPVDLVLVLGTSLQVAPFCAVPNLAPASAARVLVNRNLQDCLINAWSPAPPDGPYGSTGFSLNSSCKLAGRAVTLRPLWTCSRRRWRQLLIEDDCDAFSTRFFALAQAPGRRCREGEP